MRDYAQLVESKNRFTTSAHEFLKKRRKASLIAHHREKTREMLLKE